MVIRSELGAASDSADGKCSFSLVAVSFSQCEMEVVITEIQHVLLLQFDIDQASDTFPNKGSTVLAQGCKHGAKFTASEDKYVLQTGDC